MTKTLYDPEVEKRGYEKGISEGILQEKKEIILKMHSKGYSEAEISDITDVDVEGVQEIIKNSTR